MNQHRKRFSAVFFCLMFILCRCEGTDTGNPSDQPDTTDIKPESKVPNKTDTSSDPLPPKTAPPENSCESTERLVGLDEVTALNFSAQQLLDKITFQESTDFVWAPLPESAKVELHCPYEAGTTQVTIDVQNTAQEATYVDWTFDGDAEVEIECQNGHLEIPIEVKMVSSDGLLDEQFETMLISDVVYKGFFTHRLNPDESTMGPSFCEPHSNESELAFSLGPIDISATLYEGSSIGSIEGQITTVYTNESEQVRPPPDSGLSIFPYALWPNNHPCAGPWSYLPTEAKIAGFSIRDVYEAIGSTEPSPLTWLDGSTTTISLSIPEPEQYMCQAMESSLQFETQVKVETNDGRINSTMNIRIWASGNGTDLETIHFESTSANRPIAASSLVHEAGINGVDTKEYEEVLVIFEGTYIVKQSESSFQGSLHINGVDVEDTDQPFDNGIIPSTVLEEGNADSNQN